jgi:hypothetical protein
MAEVDPHQLLDRALTAARASLGRALLALIFGEQLYNEGCHTVHVRAWDNGGSTSDKTYGPVCFDDIPPVASCAAPDGLWHPSDAVIACTASDGLSGLANPSDASFSLTTSVPAGTETGNAFTNSHVVFDKAGNSTTKLRYLTRGKASRFRDCKSKVVASGDPLINVPKHSGNVILFTMREGDDFIDRWIRRGRKAVVLEFFQPAEGAILSRDRIPHVHWRIRNNWFSDAFQVSSASPTAVMLTAAQSARGMLNLRYDQIMPLARRLLLCGWRAEIALREVGKPS